MSQGQGNLFQKPDTQDPFGASVKEFETGIYNTENRPNISDTLKKKSQATWESQINGPQNRIK